MTTIRSFLNRTVTSMLSVLLLSAPVWAADEARLSTLHAELKTADRKEALRLAREIERERSNSGSPAMNLLLKRGTDALEAGELGDALEHFTALTDHAPDFAEGWHRRATVFVLMDRYGLAVADLEQALSLRPDHFDAIATLGGIMIQIDKLDLAKQAFDQVLALHPHHPDVTEALASFGADINGTEL